MGYNEAGNQVTKTIHVYHAEDGWAVKRIGGGVSQVFSTQREAIVSARSIARKAAPSQMVVHGVDGRIRDYVTHGLPRVQDPPGKSSGAKRIQRAVTKAALFQLAKDPHPPRV